MDEARNTQVVKDAYAAFGRGDIPALRFIEFADSAGINEAFAPGK